MSVTLYDIVGEVATSLETTRTSVEKILVAAFGAISTHLEAGEDVVLKNFARLQIKDRPGRVACNTLTKGVAIEVPPRRVVKFVPRGDLKDQLSEAL